MSFTNKQENITFSECSAVRCDWKANAKVNSVPKVCAHHVQLLFRCRLLMLTWFELRVPKKIESCFPASCFTGRAKLYFSICSSSLCSSSMWSLASTASPCTVVVTCKTSTDRPALTETIVQIIPFVTTLRENVSVSRTTSKCKSLSITRTCHTRRWLVCLLLGSMTVVWARTR